MLHFVFFSYLLTHPIGLTVVIQSKIIQGRPKKLLLGIYNFLNYYNKNKEKVTQCGLFVPES